MKRIAVPVLTLLVTAACQDATAPRPAKVTAPVAAEQAQVAVGSNLYAVVGINGTLIAGNGVTGVSASGFGTYEVTFNQNVSNCAYVATTTNAYSQAIQAYTASGHASVNGVYVETKNQGGGLTPGPFHLLVSCNATFPYAVIGYNGQLVRSSPGVSITSAFGGQYTITFSQNVAQCGYMATIGDPSNAIALNPAGVYTGSSTTANSVYIETKNPGGGLQGGLPFHLILVCAGTPRSGYAVVKSTGTFQRGSPLGGSITHASTGHYTITAPFNVGSCAKIITRGSNNTSVPFNPATVEVGASSTSTQFTAEVRALLFFGGAFADEAFHTAVIC